MGEVLRTGYRVQGTGDRERRILVAGGTVWGEDGPRRADVRIGDGLIVEVGDLARRPGEDVIDAARLHVVPGFIDVHVHVDDTIGRFELADSWYTASEAAVRTGVTTLAGFITQHPGETLTAAVVRCLARARGRSFCNVAFHLTPTSWPWDWDEVASLVAVGFQTFKLYTTYREAGLFSDYERLGAVMEHLAPLGARLLVHCEDDPTLAAIDPRSVDLGDPFSHTLLRPEAAEVRAVAGVIELAARTGCPTHVVHVSTSTAAGLVAGARSRGEPVTCETGPQYLLLDSGRLREEGGHRLLCTPPLRSAATRAQMEHAAATGTFDLFATDHCAFSRADKDSWNGDIRTVPSGLAGVGASAPLLFELLVNEQHRSLAELVRRFSGNPARLLGVYPRKGTIRAGSDADVVVLDLDGPAQPVVASLADCYQPWADRVSTLSCRWVLVGGRPTVSDGALVVPGTPTGQLLAAP